MTVDGSRSVPNRVGKPPIASSRSSRATASAAGLVQLDGSTAPLLLPGSVPGGRRPLTWWLALAFVVAVSPVVVAGCGSSDDAPSGVARWFATTRVLIEQEHPDSDVMQIDPDANCELVDTIAFDGRKPELFGAGVARFGEIGGRYQCAWSGDQNGSANVRLEVVVIDDRDDFDRYEQLVPEREGNTIVPTDLGDVHVASFQPDPNSPLIVTSVLMIREQQGAVHLVVEILHPDLNYSPREHAQQLVQLALPE